MVKIACIDKFGGEHLVEESELVDTTRVYGVLIKDNKILMVKDPRHGSRVWELPGGGVDEGETPDQALVREFKEETGLEISDFKEFDQFIEHYYADTEREGWRADRRFYIIKSSAGQLLEEGNGWDTSIATFLPMEGLLDEPIQESMKRPIRKAVQSLFKQ